MVWRKPVTFKSGLKPHLSTPVKVRSGWEHGVLLWLDHIGVKWEYESTRFVFAEGTRGKKSYLPDIHIPNYKPTKKNGLPDLGLKEIYIEIRGYMSSTDRMALVHFQRDYPEEAKKLVAITGGPNTATTKYYQKKGVPILCYYPDLEKQFSHLPHWGE